eukprot:CAMPEP_0202978010 /NCGR_PEP_ID=MMETSP1396-20130829/84589_1 /ASSEMBLY_ACC=CAM_ASM_000872 /TAXON_ID= /ORGANISM="Pseudokeronopsis sp., Strain Brazil" /LENGTH=80 /DNA_ID=CAMNT_0049716867 /DNA_START=341 /DNA_END=583 /DNA_ORIENTATION=-
MQTVSGLQNKTKNSDDDRWKSHVGHTVPIVEEEVVMQFEVVNPVKVQNFVKYTVKGVDLEGPFQELRRYNDFVLFRKALV